MFIFEKDGALHIQFGNTQIPAEEDDILIAKEDGVTSVKVQGRELASSGSSSGDSGDVDVNPNPGGDTDVDPGLGGDTDVDPGFGGDTDVDAGLGAGLGE